VAVEKVSVALVPDVSTFLLEAGFESALSPSLLKRLHILNEGSKTLQDEARALGYADRFFAHYNQTHSENPLTGDRPFSPDEMGVVRAGTILADIGKTGPVTAPEHVQRAVVAVFGVDTNFTPHEKKMTSMRQFITWEMKNPDDKRAVINGIHASGRNLTTSLGNFYNLHAQWTFDILTSAQEAPEVAAAAALHHTLEDINPRHILSKDGIIQTTGKPFGRVEKMVILLDKYDARLRRGGVGHDEAIQYLRDRVAANKRFATDAEFYELIAEMDVSLHQPSGQ
jgi:hypothetical protein